MIRGKEKTLSNRNCLTFASIVGSLVELFSPSSNCQYLNISESHSRKCLKVRVEERRVPDQLNHCFV